MLYSLKSYEAQLRKTVFESIQNLYNIYTVVTCKQAFQLSGFIYIFIGVCGCIGIGYLHRVKIQKNISNAKTKFDENSADIVFPPVLGMYYIIFTMMTFSWYAKSYALR